MITVISLVIFMSPPLLYENSLNIVVSCFINTSKLAVTYENPPKIFQGFLDFFMLSLI